MKYPTAAVFTAITFVVTALGAGQAYDVKAMGMYHACLIVSLVALVALVIISSN